jgi:hypothetical protein
LNKCFKINYRIFNFKVALNNDDSCKYGTPSKP